MHKAVVEATRHLICSRNQVGGDTTSPPIFWTDADSLDLEQACDPQPGNPRYAYAYAAALNSLGPVDDAVAVLEKAREAFPDGSEIQAF